MYESIERAIKENNIKIEKSKLMEHGFYYCHCCHKYTEWTYCKPQGPYYEYLGFACSICGKDKDDVLFYRLGKIQTIKKAKKRYKDELIKMAKRILIKDGKKGWQKMTPIRLDKHEDLGVFYKCTKCNSLNIRELAKYCDQCGIKISWPKDKKENKK